MTSLQCSEHGEQMLTVHQISPLNNITPKCIKPTGSDQHLGYIAVYSATSLLLCVHHLTRTIRSPSRRARGNGSPSRGSSLRSGSFGKPLRLTGISLSTRTNHRTLKHIHTRRAPMQIIRDCLWCKNQVLESYGLPAGNLLTLPLLDRRVSVLL